MTMRRRFFFLTLLLLTGITVTVGLWLRSHQRQEALNRQLIAALGNNDPKQALALVNAGADPNTPFQPPSPPSLSQLWNNLLHRTELPINDAYSAFHMACGSHIFIDNALLGLNTDEPLLVETMLKHGAQKNAKMTNGWTPLIVSAVLGRPKTVDVLLSHGADVNAQYHGGTALCRALVNSSATTIPSERSKAENSVRQLLAHGADPNLTGPSGVTPLQIAHDGNRPNLVALLRKAGAKK
jgi:ankyrin repeat protein